MQLLVSTARASSGAGSNVRMNRAIHLRTFASFTGHFPAPPQILAASTVFFCPIPETKK